MGIVNKICRKSIFSRLIITFLCIMIPIYILGTIIYNRSMMILSEEICNSMLSQVSFYSDGLEKEIKRIKILQCECLNDDNLNKLASIPEAINEIDKLQIVLRIQQRLNVLKSSSIYIHNVNVYLPSIGKVISSNGDFKDIPVKEYGVFKVLPTNSDSQIIYWNNRYFITAIYPTPNLYKGKSPLLIITVELSQKELESALQQFVNYHDSGAFFINTFWDFIIKSNPDDKIADRIKNLIPDKITQSQSGTKLFKINEKRYLAIYKKSDYLNMVLFKYITEDHVFTPLEKFKVWFWVFSVAALIIIILFCFSTYNFIYQPLNILVKSFQKVEGGEFNIEIEHKNDDEFGYLYKGFNSMVENIKTLINNVYKHKILVQRAELKYLQSQINPHFLYNSFFNLNNMVVKGEYDNIERFTKQLGRYFQFITRNSENAISLEKETNHARIYSEIQANRFRNRIKVEFEELPETHKSFVVPRLIIQPVIENSFVHGLKNKVCDGIISVKFNAACDNLCIVIEDNGDELKDIVIEKLKTNLSFYSDETESTGLINIHRRIQLKFGSNSGLNVSRGGLGGLKVEINIFLSGEDKNV